jgi:Rrf2 family protein
VLFSKAAEYAMRSTLLIAERSLQGERTSTTEISKSTGMPYSYVAKILQRLVKADLISSKKGRHGGFEMNQQQMQTFTIMDIINVIDGKVVFDRCVLGVRSCSSTQPGPMHYDFIKGRHSLVKLFERNTIEHICTSSAFPLNYLAR